MYRKPEVDLLPLDTDIERTLRNLRKITSIESKSMTNQRERLQLIGVNHACIPIQFLSVFIAQLA